MNIFRRICAAFKRYWQSWVDDEVQQAIDEMDKYENERRLM
jgi:hypothetical protein